MATNVISGSFAGTGQSATYGPKVSDRNTNVGAFNVWLSGAGTATIQLERSPDQGVTWCQYTAGGTQLYVWSYAGTNISDTVQELESGVLYRLNCTAWTSAVSYRLSQ